MSKTVMNLLDKVLGPNTWVGRALRAPANFLLRRALKEMRREKKDVRHALAKLRGEAEDLRRAVSGIHCETRTARVKAQGMQAEITALAEQVSTLARRDEITALAEQVSNLARRCERVSNLETLLLEHPKIYTRNATVLGGKTAAFPSPVVSIIVPTWNRADVIGEAIESVLAQSFADWELIIVDDGSTDRTEDAVARFADPRIRYHKKDHAGQCVARNHALRLAKGALIAYLDSDNLWYPDFLACAVAAFAVDPSTESAYGGRVGDPPVPRLLFEPFDRERLLERSFIGMSSFIHRRALYERFGGFDENLRALEDWDLVLRYTQETPARRLPVLAVRYRVMDEDHRVTAMEALAPNHEKSFANGIRKESKKLAYSSQQCAAPSSAQSDQ